MLANRHPEGFWYRRRFRWPTRSSKVLWTAASAGKRTQAQRAFPEAEVKGNGPFGALWWVGAEIPRPPGK